MLDHALDLARFVEASPSSFHAAEEVARRLEASGFTRLREDGTWPGAAGADGSPGGRRFVVVRDGAVVAWALPTHPAPASAFRVLGTHTDSPGLVLKPRPDSVRDGWRQAGVEVYGGPLLNSWLDRELELAGRITTLDGTEHLVRTGPLLRIPQLAIHLDRSANESLALDKQRHVQPVWGLAGDPSSEAGLIASVAGVVGVLPADVAGYDLRLTDTQPPRVFGAQDAFLASGRLDNLLSVHAGLVALLDVPADVPDIAVLAAFDHEEIGSETRSGACGPFLADVLDRIDASLGRSAEDAHRARAGSVLVSSDVGHSVHPNYPERHDPTVRPVAGGGPILKVNANQRYVTDAPGAALWARACRMAGVPSQEFVSNNAVACGSTIGPLAATRLGIRTVDVGVPILSMHSARELTAVVDPWYLSRAMGAVLRGA